MTTYSLASTVPLATLVTDEDGVETDAATAVLTITLPDGTTATPTVPPTVTPGHYRVDYVPTLPGRYGARWVFTGPSASVTDAFDVDGADPGWIVSLADVKAHLNKTGATDDDELRTFIAAATEVIEKDPDIGVGPVVVQSFTERHRSGYYLTLRRAPVVSVTSVEPWTNLGTTHNPADLRIDQERGIVERRDGGYLLGPLAVTYKAGRAIVPANIRLAALEMVKHWWESQRGAPPGLRPHQQQTDDVILSSGYAIPRRVAEMLRAHRSVTGFA